MLAPQKDHRRLAEPAQIDPAGGVEQQSENGRHPGPSRGGSPAPHRGLRAPAAAAIPRSVPRRVAGNGPILVPLTRPLHRSGRARHNLRHKASEDLGIADGRDRRQCVLKAVRRLPIGLSKRGLAKGAVGLLRAMPGPTVPGQQGLTNRDLTDPSSTNPGSTNPSSTNLGSTNPDLTDRDLTNLGLANRDGHSREQPGPMHPVLLPRRARAVARTPDPSTTARGLPAMPGRGESLAPAEGPQDAAIAARGGPSSPAPNLPGRGRLGPGHGPAARRQNQGSLAFAGASRIGKNPEHDRQR